MSEEVKDELERVSVGDRLVVDAFGRYGTFTVERVTATQAICERDVRFNLKTGRRVGEVLGRGGWGYSIARKFTAQDRIRERIKAAQNGLAKIIVSEDNLESAESLIAAAIRKG